MQRVFRQSALAVSMLLCVSAGYAALPVNDWLSLDGNVRFRTEVDGRDFNQDTGMYDYSSMRSQLGVSISPSESWSLRAKMSEARFLGTTGSNKPSTASLEFHEIYLMLRSLRDLPLDLQVGRFEMWYGSKRILGSGGWNVYGPRTYDGARLQWARSDKMRWDLFHVITVERSASVTPSNGDPFSRGDRRLTGIAGKVGMFQPLVMIEQDARSSAGTDGDQLITAGLNVQWSNSPFKVRADLGYQTGTKNSRDLNSWLLSGEVNYQFDAARNPVLGLGADITSGNGADTPADEDHVFYAPYMSRHLHRGYMDYFKDVNNGLMDVFARAGFEPFDKTSLRLDYHLFQYMEEAVSAAGNYTDLGSELDFLCKARLQKGLSLTVGYSMFMPSSDWVPGGDNASFAYVELTGKF